MRQYIHLRVHPLPQVKIALELLSVRSHDSDQLMTIHLHVLNIPQEEAEDWPHNELASEF